MDAPSTSERKGVSKFELLPPEIRCMIYYYLIVEPHPLPLLQSSRPEWDENALRTYAIRKDLRVLRTCRKVYEEMSEMINLIYSELCFSYSIRIPAVEEGTEAFRIDLTRIQKLYISVDDITGWPYESDDEGTHWSNEPGQQPDYFDYEEFVASLAFGGHQLKYLLIECEPQECVYLAAGLSPLALLRKIRLVHFRAGDARMHAHLRVLETIMMSDQPMEFRNLMDFDQENDHYWIGENPENGLVEYLDTTTGVVVKSEEQMEATARELYSILGMGQEFVAQADLDERWFAERESTWSVYDP